MIYCTLDMQESCNIFIVNTLSVNVEVKRRRNERKEPDSENEVNRNEHVM